MLESLKNGCLVTGGQSNQAYYTLDRAYCLDEGEMKNKVHIVVYSSEGIVLFGAGKGDYDTIVRLGQEAINSRRRYHKSVLSALSALNEAGNLPPPSPEERMFQLSIGGDVDALVVGKFLPCNGQLQSSKLYPKSCACGFEVQKSLLTSKVRWLLKCKCM